MLDAPQKLLLASISSFQHSGLYSDCTITCKGKIFKAHKLIICGRSAFFSHSLSFGGQETQSNTVNLPEDDPKIIKLLIKYLYEGDYESFPKRNDAPITPPVPKPSSTATSTTAPRSTGPSLFGTIPATTNNRPRQNASPSLFTYPSTTSNATPGPSLFAPPLGSVPDKAPATPHSCSGLFSTTSCTRVLCKHHTCKDACCTAFLCYRCYTPPEDAAAKLLTHAQMYEIGDKYDVAGLKELALGKFKIACQNLWFTPEFVEAARHAWTTTPDTDRGLRDVVVETICRDVGIVGREDVQALLVEFGGLGAEVLKMKVKRGWT